MLQLQMNHEGQNVAILSRQHHEGCGEAKRVLLLVVQSQPGKRNCHLWKSPDISRGVFHSLSGKNETFKIFSMEKREQWSWGWCSPGGCPLPLTPGGRALYWGKSQGKNLHKTNPLWPSVSTNINFLTKLSLERSWPAVCNLWWTLLPQQMSRIL